MLRAVGIVIGLVLLFPLIGCAPRERQASVPPNKIAINGYAKECLKRGIQYRHNTVVRVEAIEAFQAGDCAGEVSWIRSALLDEQAAVRFAACLALGALKDESARDVLWDRVQDDDASVRVAAMGALHCLGVKEFTGGMPEYLLSNDDPAVRRNAAMVLGRMGEPSVVKILARAMGDKDEGVQKHALESMALLGNVEARQQLAFMANSGLGSEEVFGVNALAETRDRANYELFLYKIQTAHHLETKLAAARGLGLLGMVEGYELALRCVDFDSPKAREDGDTMEGQALRTRLLAIAALGAIGEAGALSILEKVMLGDDDPRVQVSAARAILEILSHGSVEDGPLATSTRN